MSKKINFLGIGVQKAGTSWLYTQLKKHQEIWLPPRKELHYFDRKLHYPSPSFLATENFSERINSNTPHNIDFKIKLEKELKQVLNSKNNEHALWYINYFLGTYNDDWYKSLFNYSSKKITGEITPAYSFLNINDIKNVYNINPNMKLILIFRNPVDRAWSQLNFYKMIHKIPSDLSLNDIKIFIDSPEQIIRSDYLSILNNWLNIFPKEQLHICFYDELVQNPQLFLNKIFTFLNVSTLKYQNSELNTKINASNKKPIPKEIKKYLADKYINEIKLLYKKLNNSYILEWINDLEKIT